MDPVLLSEILNALLDLILGFLPSLLKLIFGV